MSKPYFISDLHLGHKNLLNWAGDFRGGTDIESHNDWLVDSINSTCTKRDVLWVLGDIAWNNKWLKRVGEIKAQVNMILGNHDRMILSEYFKYGRVKPGLVSYKGFWLSHAPIHPFELRGRRNIHGHVHQHSITERAVSKGVTAKLDDRYINVSVEALYGKPLCLYDIPNYDV